MKEKSKNEQTSMKTCTCSCDEDAPIAYWETNPIARKHHVCCECGSTIDPGERYWNFKGIWENKFSTFKTCEICKYICTEAYANGIECIPFGCLYEIVGSEFE